MTIIGLDPHPASHSVAALDANGKSLASLTVGNHEEGLAQLWQWAESFSDRVWAVEGAGNRFIATWVEQLLLAHETVVNIPPTLTSQYRSRRGRKKNDVIDAENAARALAANADLPPYQPGEEQAELQALSRNRERLAKQLKANRMALDALPPHSPAGDALEAAIASLAQAIKTLEQELAQRVKVLVPELLEEQGISYVLAGVLMAETGNIARFETEAKFASYCGSAPVTRGSGQNMRAQVNAGGNRRLNRALHLIARTRLRDKDGRSKALMDKKMAEGKTKKEAFRVLKTYIARELYRLLKAIWPWADESTLLAA